MSTLFLVLGIAALAAAAFLPIRGGFTGAWKAGTGVLAALGLACLFVGVSVVQVAADEVGHLRRIYGGRSLPAGRVIAADRENGY